MAKLRNKIPRGSYLDLAVQKVIPRAIETEGDLLQAVQNNTLNNNQLSGLNRYQQDLISKNLKAKAIKDGSLSIEDAVKANDISTKEIIEAGVTRVRAENIENRIKDEVAESLTPSRDKLRKMTAAQILLNEKLNSGGVK